MSTVKVAYEVEPRPRQHPVRKGEDSPCTDHRLCDMCFQVLLLIIFVTTGYAVYRVFHPSVPSYDLGDLFRPKSGSLVTPDVVPSTPTVAAAPVSKGPSKIMERLVREIHRAVDASSSPAPKVAPLASKAADSKAASEAEARRKYGPPPAWTPPPVRSSSSEASSSSASSSEASSSSASSSEASSSASSSEASEATQPTLSDSFKTHIRLWVEYVFDGYSEYYRRKELKKALRADVTHLENQLKKVHDEPPCLEVLEMHEARYNALEQGKRHQRERVDALLDLDREFNDERYGKFVSIKNKLKHFSVNFEEFRDFVGGLIREFTSSSAAKHQEGVSAAVERCWKDVKSFEPLCQA